MRYTAEQRRKESKPEHDKRVAEWKRRIEKQREPEMEIPAAFDFKLVGGADGRGAEAWVIEATPKAEYKPKSSATAYLAKMKARFWIAKKDCEWLKMEAQALDTITFGAILVPRPAARAAAWKWSRRAWRRRSVCRRNSWCTPRRAWRYSRSITPTWNTR